MGFYLRKALSFGPLRLNFSRSGLGVSVGVKGARLGIGPRGQYVHLGRGGLYYRQRIDRTGGTNPTPVNQQVLSGTVLNEIESVDAHQMSDSSAVELLNELNRVRRRTDIFPLVLFILLPAVLLLNTNSGASRWVWAFSVLATGAIAVYARHFDVTNGTAVLTYTLDSNAASEFARMKSTFEKLLHSERVWHVEASGETDDWKRNAGVSTLVQRSVIRPKLSQPPRTQCNLQVPTIPAGKQTLYFFPDRLLIYDDQGVGAVPYSELRVEASNTRFVEEETAPRDASILGHTWKFVNKSGGPDRRFSSNRQLPVMQYAELRFTSRTGLNEMFQCSSTNGAHTFAAAFSEQTKGKVGIDGRAEPIEGVEP